MMFSHVKSVILGGVLLVSHVLASPTPQIIPPPFPPAVIKCDTAFAKLPLYEDCKIAISNIIVPDPPPRACPAVIRHEHKISTYLSCTVQAFSKQGHAHCLNAGQVKAEATRILNDCALKGVDGIKTGGAAFFVDNGKGAENGDGVRLVKEEMVVLPPQPGPFEASRV